MNHHCSLFTMSLSDLPNEILDIVTDHLCAKDIVSFGSVCHYFHEFTKQYSPIPHRKEYWLYGKIVKMLNRYTKEIKDDIERSKIIGSLVNMLYRNNYFDQINLLDETKLLGQLSNITNNSLFGIACEVPSIEFAKWVLSLGDVDIHAFFDSAYKSAFRSCQQYGKTKYDFYFTNLCFDHPFLKFIRSLDPNYHWHKIDIELIDSHAQMQNWIFLRILGGQSEIAYENK